MDHFIVRQRQHEVFGERVGHGERDQVVIVPAEVWIHGDILKHIVHPAHVPFEVEPKAAHFRRFCHVRPCRRLFSYHQYVREVRKDILVQHLKETDSLFVFRAALIVWSPFTIRPVVIQIKHRCDRIDP